MPLSPRMPPSVRRSGASLCFAAEDRRERILLIPFYCNTNQGILQTLFAIFRENFHKCTFRCMSAEKGLCILLFFALDQNGQTLPDP